MCHFPFHRNLTSVSLSPVYWHGTFLHAVYSGTKICVIVSDFVFALISAVVAPDGMIGWLHCATTITVPKISQVLTQIILCEYDEFGIISEENIARNRQLET